MTKVNGIASQFYFFGKDRRGWTREEDFKVAKQQLLNLQSAARFKSQANKVCVFDLVDNIYDIEILYYFQIINLLIKSNTQTLIEVPGRFSFGLALTEFITKYNQKIKCI